MLGGLRAGPKSRFFSMGIIGERGVGKTVLLIEIERQAKSSLGSPTMALATFRSAAEITSNADR